MDTVKVSWSGGKDSTCALSLHLDRGDKVIGVCYVPMFTDTIPLLLKDHYEHILRTADHFRELGAEIHIVSGISYYDFCKRRSTMGKYKGRAFGFPPFITSMCNFKKESKIKALRKVDIGEYDYEDVGLACDEIRRLQQLSEKSGLSCVKLAIQKAMRSDIAGKLGCCHRCTTVSRETDAFCVRKLRTRFAKSGLRIIQKQNPL